MQNILLQIGLQLISRERFIIQKASRFALSCRSCSLIICDKDSAFPCHRCECQIFGRVKTVGKSYGSIMPKINDCHIKKRLCYSISVPSYKKNKDQEKYILRNKDNIERKKNSNLVKASEKWDFT